MTVRLSRNIIYIVLAFICQDCSILKHNVSSYRETVFNIDINLIRIEGGCFIMGCEDKNIVINEDEMPAHNVCLNDFYIGKYEITFEQYDIFCEQTGKIKPDDNNWGRGSRPVINVNWYDACDFCKWLSEVTGNIYRLPTEAEWEYAAKGGSKNKSYNYSGSEHIDEVAWYSKDSINQLEKHHKDGKTSVVGQKKSNELGIFDMSGNVWEWCLDGYDKSFYRNSSIENPIGLGVAKVARGGSWYTNASYCIVTNRDYDISTMKDNDLGFRIVKELRTDKDNQ